MPTTNRADRARFAAQMAEIAERVGKRIKELREARKLEDPRWTQDYLARQLPGNTSGSEVSRWERGQIKPRDETARFPCNGSPMSECRRSATRPSASTA